MPYPAKTSAEQILSAATVLLERQGALGLSLRGLAAELDLTPNALYRYFGSREALLSALAVQAAAQLRAELESAPDLEELASRYLRFAHSRPALYDLYMTCDSLSTEQQAVYAQLWALVVRRLEPLAGVNSPDAAVTLWSYLHGLIGLERSGVFAAPGNADHVKPRQEAGSGLRLLLAGLAALKRDQPQEPPPNTR